MVERGAFTIPEFCAWSRIGRTKVYELIANGDLHVVKIGTKTLIRRVDAEELLNRFLTKIASPSNSDRSEAAA